MRIKKGDTVVVITGADRGKTGKVLSALPKHSQIVIAGVNIKKRHKRATRSGQKGQIVEITMPVHVSNAMLVEDGKPVRTGVRRVSGERQRISKASGKAI
jgi:large subunit ribosomal protein L24